MARIFRTARKSTSPQQREQINRQLRIARREAARARRRAPVAPPTPTAETSKPPVDSRADASPSEKRFDLDPSASSSTAPPARADPIIPPSEADPIPSGFSPLPPTYVDVYPHPDDLSPFDMDAFDAFLESIVGPLPIMVPGETEDLPVLITDSDDEAVAGGDVIEVIEISDDEEDPMEADLEAYLEEELDPEEDPIEMDPEEEELDPMEADSAEEGYQHQYIAPFDLNEPPPPESDSPSEEPGDGDSESDSDSGSDSDIPPVATSDSGYAASVSADSSSSSD